MSELQPFLCHVYYIMSGQISGTLAYNKLLDHIKPV